MVLGYVHQVGMQEITQGLAGLGLLVKEIIHGAAIRVHKEPLCMVSGKGGRDSWRLMG